MEYLPLDRVQTATAWAMPPMVMCLAGRVAMGPPPAAEGARGRPPRRKTYWCEPVGARGARLFVDDGRTMHECDARGVPDPGKASRGLCSADIRQSGKIPCGPLEVQGDDAVRWLVMISPAMNRDVGPFPRPTPPDGAPVAFRSRWKDVSSVLTPWARWIDAGCDGWSAMDTVSFAVSASYAEPLAIVRHEDAFESWQPGVPRSMWAAVRRALQDPVDCWGGL